MPCTSLHSLWLVVWLPWESCSKSKKSPSKTAEVPSGARSGASLKVVWAAASNGVSRDLATVDSLKYYLNAITLAETLESNGSGYDNLQGTVQVYSSQKDDYSTFLLEEAAANTEDYKDVSELSSLPISIELNDEDKAKNLQYVVVNWFRPLKIKASTASLFTHPGTTLDQQASKVTSDTLLTQEPSEEAVVVLNNGGSWFRLPEAFQMTGNDSWVMLMVHDAANSVFGYTAGQSSRNNLEDADGNGFLVNMMPLSPVFYRDGVETVREDTYRIHVAYQQEPPFDVLVRVYIVVASESTRIGAVLSVIVPVEGEAQLDPAVSPMAPQGFYLNQADGKLDAFIWDNATPVFKGLPLEADGTCELGVFQGLANVNDPPAGADTLTVECAMSFMGSRTVV